MIYDADSEMIKESKRDMSSGDEIRTIFMFSLSQLHNVAHFEKCNDKDLVKAC